MNDQTQWDGEQKNLGWKGKEFTVKKISTLPFICSVILGKFVNFRVPQFLHLLNENNNATHLMVIRI